MALDRTQHPASQKAVRVFFACFIAGVVLAMADVMRESRTRSTGFWVACGVIALITACSIVAYFKQRGFAAFVVRTAYVGVFIVAGTFAAASQAKGLPKEWVLVVVVCVLSAWIIKGVKASFSDEK